MIDLNGLTREELYEFRKAMEHLVSEKMKQQDVISQMGLSEHQPKQEPIVQPKPDYVKFHSRWGR